MNSNSLRTAAAILVTLSMTACGSGSRNDRRLEELEKQLAETQKQLAESKGTEVTTAPAPVEQPQAAAPAAAPAQPQRTQPGAKPAAAKPASTPQRPTSPPESQKYATADQVAQNRADAERLVAEQRNVNARQTETNSQVQSQIEQMKPREFTLPAGTVIPVRTTTELSTANLSNGSTFEGTLEHDLKVEGTTVARAKTRVTGVVVTADKGGRVKGVASLTVGLRSIVGPKGNTIPVSTDQYTTDAESTKGKDVKRTGIATGVGAVIGGIAGGGSGAAQGAGIGAAAGVGATLATRGAAAVIPAEQLLEFHLAAPVTVVIQP